MAYTDPQQPETILHLSKEGQDLGEFHGGLEDLLKFAIAHNIESRLDGLHVAREAVNDSPTQQYQQEDTEHE